MGWGVKTRVEDDAEKRGNKKTLDMKKMICLLAAVAILSGGFSACEKEETDQDKIEGTWTAQSGQLRFNGEAVPGAVEGLDAAKGLPTFRFSGDRFTLKTSSGEENYKYSVFGGNILLRGEGIEYSMFIAQLTDKELAVDIPIAVYDDSFDGNIIAHYRNKDIYTRDLVGGKVIYWYYSGTMAVLCEPVSEAPEPDWFDTTRIFLKKQ